MQKSDKTSNKVIFSKYTFEMFLFYVFNYKYM